MHENATKRPFNSYSGRGHGPIKRRMHNVDCFVVPRNFNASRNDAVTQIRVNNMGPVRALLFGKLRDPFQYGAVPKHELIMPGARVGAGKMADNAIRRIDSLILQTVDSIFAIVDGTLKLSRSANFSNSSINKPNNNWMTANCSALRSK